MNSHGMVKGVINKNSLNIVREKCLNFLNHNPTINNYTNEISKYVENIEELINPNIIKKIEYLIDDSNPKLCAIELHIQKAGCNPIPPHQDNFYHCVPHNKGIKFLIPLTKLNMHNGGLFYSDSNVDFEILKHSPTKIENFSSFIEDKIFKNLDLNYTNYSLSEGDAAYHFLNSIHFSKGNKTANDSLFLVFRYQSRNVEINELSLLQYQKCYEEHLEMMSN